MLGGAGANVQLQSLVGHPRHYPLLERPGLHAVTVDGHVLALERLDDKVGHDTAVVRVHPRAKGAARRAGGPRSAGASIGCPAAHSLEDTGDTDVDAVLALEAVGEGLGDTLALVVARADADGVDVAPAAKRGFSMLIADRNTTATHYSSRWGCSSGSPYTSEVEVIRKRALTRLARPSMLSVPMNDVLTVLTGLYW